MTGVAQPWKQATQGANTDHLIILRTSIVLQPESPALDRLLLLAKLGVGGAVGSGQQWFSWIHLQDWLRIARAAPGLEPEVQLPTGAVIAAAPSPVRNRELMAQLRRVTGSPSGCEPRRRWSSSAQCCCGPIRRSDAPVGTAPRRCWSGPGSGSRTPHSARLSTS